MARVAGKWIVGPMMIGMVSSAVLAADEPATAAGSAAPTQTVATPATAATKYFEIPVFGHLGTDVTPEALEAAFNEAEQANAKYVVLLFDTPGGDPAAVLPMTRTIMSHSKVISVGFVRRATGTGALLAATCSKLYVYKTGVWGTTGLADCTDMAACHTQIDQVAAATHRNVEAFRALSDWGSELYLRTVDGKPVLETTPGDGDGRVLKQKNSGLVLAPQDMVVCQIADGICATMGDIRRSLGVGDWESCGSRGAEIVASLRQEPKVDRITLEAQPQEQPPTQVYEYGPTKRQLQRDNMYYKARAAERRVDYDEARKAEDRALVERRRQEDEARAAENRRYLREQDWADKARKQRW